MRKLFLLFCLLFSSSLVIAAQRVAVNVDVKLQRPGTYRLYHIHHVVLTSTNNRQWDILKDRTKKKTQIVLLTKIVKATSREIALKFLVVDNHKQLKILSSKMIVAYGQKGAVNLREGQHKMHLAVKVDPI